MATKKKQKAKAKDGNKNMYVAILNGHKVVQVLETFKVNERTFAVHKAVFEKPSKANEHKYTVSDYITGYSVGGGLAHSDKQKAIADAKKRIRKAFKSGFDFDKYPPINDRVFLNSYSITTGCLLTLKLMQGNGGAISNRAFFTAFEHFYHQLKSEQNG